MLKFDKSLMFFPFDLCSLGLVQEILHTQKSWVGSNFIRLCIPTKDMSKLFCKYNIPEIDNGHLKDISCLNAIGSTS